MYKKIWSAIFVIFLTLGCQSSVMDATQFAKLADDGEAVEFETIEKGTFGNTDIEKQNLVIRDYDAFERVWKELYEGRNPVPEMPVIDFESEMVVAAFLGKKPHGGYTVEISDMVLSDKLGVKVISTKPGDDCMLTMAITAPYHLVKVPKVEGSAKFYEETKVNKCSG